LVDRDVVEGLLKKGINFYVDKPLFHASRYLILITHYQ